MDTKEAIKRPEGEANLSVYAIEQLRAIYANKSSDEYKSHGDIKKSVQYSNIEFLVGELYNLIDYPKNQANDMRSIFTALHNPVWNKNVTEYIKKPTVDNTTWTLVYTVGFRIMIGELARVFASTVAKDDGIHYVPSKIKEDEDRLDYIHNFNENLIKKLNDNINSKKSSTVTKEAFEMLDAYIESGALNEEVYTSIFLEGAGMCPKCGKEPCVCESKGSAPTTGKCPKCHQEPCICECGDNIAPTEEACGDGIKATKECGDGTCPPTVKQESAEILYEAVTTEKVDSCIANCINGFTQIVNKITKEGCTQKQFKKFWSSTQEGNLWIGTKWTVDGEKFKKSVKKTMKYLTKGANKGIFGENGEEARKCYDVLLVTYKNCNDAAAGKMALDKLPESCNKALESLKAVRGKIGNAPISEFFVDASDDYMFEFEYEESDEEVVTEAVLNLSGVVDIANDVFRVFTKTFSAIFRSVKELRPKSFVNACLTKSYEKKVDKFAESVTMYKETKAAYDDYMRLPEARRKDKVEHKYLKLIDKYNAKMENRKAKIIHYDQRSIEETMDEAKKVMQDVEKTSTKPDPNTSSEASGTDINDAPANTPPEDLGF